jgi:hypothetical protein
LTLGPYARGSTWFGFGFGFGFGLGSGGKECAAKHQQQHAAGSQRKSQLL